MEKKKSFPALLCFFFLHSNRTPLVFFSAQKHQPQNPTTPPLPGSPYIIKIALSIREVAANEAPKASAHPVTNQRDARLGHIEFLRFFFSCFRGGAKGMKPEIFLGCCFLI